MDEERSPEKRSYRRHDMRIVVRSVRELRKTVAGHEGRIGDLESDRDRRVAYGDDSSPTELVRAPESKKQSALTKPMSPQAIAAAVVNLMIGLVYLLIELLKAAKKL